MADSSVDRAARIPGLRRRSTGRAGGSLSKTGNQRVHPVREWQGGGAVSPTGIADAVIDLHFTLEGDGGVGVTNVSLTGDHVRFTAPSFSGTGLDCSGGGCPAVLTVVLSMVPFCIDVSPCPYAGTPQFSTDFSVTVQ